MTTQDPYCPCCLHFQLNIENRFGLEPPGLTRNFLISWKFDNRPWRKNSILKPEARKEIRKRENQIIQLAFARNKLPVSSKKAGWIERQKLNRNIISPLKNQYFIIQNLCWNFNPYYSNLLFYAIRSYPFIITWFTIHWNLSTAIIYYGASAFNVIRI